MKIFLTGASGFIGFHTAFKLLSDGHTVIGFDNNNNYYDPKIKHQRLKLLKKFDLFRFISGNLEDRSNLVHCIKRTKPSHILHLAAQAGVRYSLENPMAYVNSNLIGFQNVIDTVKEYKPENFVYASSSSVYGGNRNLPFNEDDVINKPLSLYAATKISNEMVAESYAHLYNLPCTGLRFFTVYGPYPRPDLAIDKFANAMLEGRPIQLYNNGQMSRDFTYVEDIVQGIILALKNPQVGKIYNLGSGIPTSLDDLIMLLKRGLGMSSEFENLPMQPGDVPVTCADISKAKRELGYIPIYNFAWGITEFCKWFLEKNNLSTDHLKYGTL